MPRFWLSTFLIFVLTSVAQFCLPWWVVVPLCFGVGTWSRLSGGRALLAGLLGVGLSWWLPAAWLTMHGAERLASRLAVLLPLGGSPWALVLISGVVAGLAGGLAALSGAWARQALQPQASRPGIVQ